MSIAYNAHDLSYNAYAAPTVECHAPSAADAGSRVIWLLFSFHGRATRAQYWGVYILGSAGFGVFIALTIPLLAIVQKPLLDVLVLIPTFLLFLWIMLAIQVKRWHDRGKSGAWCLIGVLPYIGAIWKFVELGCLSGTPDRNHYGPDPRAELCFPLPPRFEVPDRHAVERDIAQRAFAPRDLPERETPKRQLIVPRRVATH